MDNEGALRQGRPPVLRSLESRRPARNVRQRSEAARSDCGPALPGATSREVLDVGSVGKGKRGRGSNLDGVRFEIGNVVEVGAVPNENAIEVVAGSRGDNKFQPFLGQRIVSVDNSVHHNTVIWDEGATGGFGYFLSDTTYQADFFTKNVAPDYNEFHLPSTGLSLFVYDGNDSGQNARKTFADYRAAGADPHGTVDALFKSGFPSVAVTSPPTGRR
jgi:hypothetical protein